MPRIGPLMMIDRVPGTSRLLSLNSQGCVVSYRDLLESRVWEAPFVTRTGTRGHVPGLLGPDLARHVNLRSSRKIHRLGWKPKGGCPFSSWFLS